MKTHIPDPLKNWTAASNKTAPEFTPDNAELALCDGWILAVSDGKLEIQRDDSSEQFDSDAAALSYVKDLARPESWPKGELHLLAKTAMALIAKQEASP